MEELKVTIHRIKQNLEERSYPNERSITTRVVMPVLRSIGWDVDDPKMVHEEYSVIPGQEGKKVDLALSFNREIRKPDVFIEVKAHGVLQNPEAVKRAENQLSEYERYYRVTLAILTDGQQWYFYYPLAGGTYYDRRALSLDVCAGAEEEVAQYISNLLSFHEIKENHVSSRLLELHRQRSQDERIRTDFPDVWKKLLESPNDFFIQGVQDAFQEHNQISPKPEIIKILLKDLVGTNLDYPINSRSSLVAQPLENQSDYLTDSNNSFPLLRSRESKSQTKIIVTFNWQTAGKNLTAETIDEGSAAQTLVSTLQKLASVFGQDILERLVRNKVGNGPLVSKNPQRDYINPQKGSLYSYEQIPHTNYYVFTHISTDTKIDDLGKVIRELNLPAKLMKIEKVEK
jgi:hypothetical protein